MKHILCCVDGSEHADIALRAAIQLSAKLSADLSLLVVNVSFGRSPRGPQALIWTNDEAQAILDKACDVVARNGQKPALAGITVAREASTGIIDHALEHDIDAIVIGTGDKRGMSRLFLGSVAMDVANRAPCTVIVAR
ncbi:universal stress protein [Fertoebacter nigrum]|uniref:Universal stress protein n=1 Tax=Fertoeibacter niger TaxID=2656921 RepID=A0A8X8H4G8_9RHOB|nr:universal stress protein [Fertoeibacter niger]NUB46199.1 universal stress protein [Fertoeibacter niger]